MSLNTGRFGHNQTLSKIFPEAEFHSFTHPSNTRGMGIIFCAIQWCRRTHCVRSGKYIIFRVATNLTFSNSAEAEFGQISELKFVRS